jgi:hypothetical protein
VREYNYILYTFNFLELGNPPYNRLKPPGGPRITVINHALREGHRLRVFEGAEENIWAQDEGSNLIGAWRKLRNKGFTEYHLLGYSAVEFQPTFRKDISPPYSGWKK